MNESVSPPRVVFVDPKDADLLNTGNFDSVGNPSLCNCTLSRNGHEIWRNGECQQALPFVEVTEAVKAALRAAEIQSPR